MQIADLTAACHIQAALTSAPTFAVGAALPLGMVLLVPADVLFTAETIASLAFLLVLGAVGARAGGAPMPVAIILVTFCGAIAMALTAGIGRLFGAVV